MIEIKISYYSKKAHPHILKFPQGPDGLFWSVEEGATVGAKGIDSLSSDLLDVAFTIYHIEKYLSPFRSSPIENVTLRIPVNNTTVWQDATTIDLLTKVLTFMNPLPMTFIFTKKNKTASIATDTASYNPVVLFSGGMDSTCGLAVYKKDLLHAGKIVSFSTRQKKSQNSILSKLGYGKDQLIRFHSTLKLPDKPKTSHFTLRSFMFLSLAAVVARSYDIGEVWQFENGVLAMAVPPSPSITMTKHAHPIYHQYFTGFVNRLFQDTSFVIRNPFLHQTKGEMYKSALKKIRSLDDILVHCETCWFHYSNFSISGEKKTPNMACGLCVPCIIRRVADPHYQFEFDIAKKKILDNDKIGFVFRTYQAFANKVIDCRTEEEFYMRALDGETRGMVSTGGTMDLSQLFDLFKRFSKEFLSTFHTE